LNFKPQDAYDCEPCSDTGWVYVFGDEGKNLGVKPCECLLRRMRQIEVNRIPPRYRKLSIETIFPQPSRHPTQARVIANLKAQPSSSYLFLGRNGCGKSQFGWVLYRAAVDANRPAIAIALSDLLMEFRAWDVDKIQPRLTAESLRERKGRWLIFIDEIEKARPSEFAAEKLFRILDEIYNFNHQLVITSNLRPAELKKHWSRADEQYGPSIMRRLFELPDAVHVEMF
jgi:DNA replication protein DnaC